MRKLLETLKGSAAALALGLNVLAIFTCMMPFALVKLVVPARAVRRVCDHALNALAFRWIAFNDLIMATVGRTRWDIEGLAGLKRRGW